MFKSDGWLSFQEIEIASCSKKLILYGRSEDWLPKTISRLHIRPELILDQNPKYENTEYNGIPVFNSSKIDKLQPSDYFVIITSSIFLEIEKKLENLGWSRGKDFCCSPAYRDYSQLNAMKNYTPDLLVSSSDYPAGEAARSSENGGGLFHITDQYQQPRLVLSGAFRQISKFDENFLAVDSVNNHLVEFNLEGKIKNSIELEFANYCGLTIINERGLIVAVNAGKDIISLFDLETFKLVKHVPFGEKSYNSSLYHINDCCSDGISLFISYFSKTGTYTKGIFDGGVVEFNIDKPEKSHELYRDLWMPHSPEIIDGSLHVCDSMRGKVYQNDKTEVCQINCFARGLCFDGSYYYVGSSENMYISRLKNHHKHVLAFAGVFMVDPNINMSRFIPFQKNMNIHDIVSL